MDKLFLVAFEALDGIDPDYTISDWKSVTREFFDQLCKAIPCPDETLYTELTPGLSVHSGAGMVGVAFVAAE